MEFHLTRRERCTDEMAYIIHTDKAIHGGVCIRVQNMRSKGCITIIVFGVDGEAELVDQELAHVGATLARGEVKSGAFVGIPHGGCDSGGARALLVESGGHVCKKQVTSGVKDDSGSETVVTDDH